MATIITAAVLEAAAEGVRASVNHQWFVEAGALEAEASGVAAKIRTGVGAGILTIHEWQPVDAADDVDHLKPFRVNFSANAAAAEKSILYDDGTSGEQWSNGTLEDATAVGDGIQLAVDAPLIDFEDYNLATIQTSGQPHVWTWLGGNAAWYRHVTDTLYLWPPGGKRTHCTTGNGATNYRLDDAGLLGAGTLAADVLFDNSYGSAGRLGLMMNLTGSGTAMRGHSVYIMQGSGYLGVYRHNSATSTFGIGSVSLGFTIASNVLYHLKAKFTTNGTTTWFYGKCWADGNSEPVSFTYLGSDTSYVAPGYVGIFQNSGAAGQRINLDNFAVEPDPSVYCAEGSWESGEIDATDVGLYSFATVAWDETLPTDTTASVFARWRAGSSWLACTNGGEIPGIDCGEEMTAGSSKDSLELRVELETTDTSTTPSVGNLSVDFVPFDPEGLEIELDGGTISCVTADGSLEVWGMLRLVGGVNDIGYSDLWAESLQPYHLFIDDKALEAALVYGGWEIGSIIVSLARDKWSESSPLIGFQFSMDPIKYEGPPIECRYNVHDKWSPDGRGYEWVLIDRGIAIHADGWYIVGHVQRDNHPGQLIVGFRERVGHPGSLLVKGFRRDRHLGELLVQGDKRDGQPGMFMVSTPARSSQPGSFLVGIKEREGHPGSYLVYGVNRDGAIFVNVISDTTYAKLVAAGIVMT